MSSPKIESPIHDHAAAMEKSTDNPPRIAQAERLVHQSEPWIHRLQFRHYVAIDRHWSLPTRIRSGSNDLDRWLFYLDFKYSQTRNQVKDLTPEDCRLFCWKDCAIYVNRGPDDFEVSHDARETVYREWFPHRARDQDFANESYFAKNMRFHPPAQTLEEIANFHGTLCGKLQSLEADILEREPAFPFNLVAEERRKPGQFKLRPTFLNVFIVIEDGWETHGVLLVCMDEHTAEVLVGTAAESDAAAQRYEVTDGSDLGGKCVFRCPLTRAMKIVVSQDPERAKKRKEFCVRFNETYGSEDDES